MKKLSSMNLLLSVNNKFICELPGRTSKEGKHSGVFGFSSGVRKYIIYLEKGVFPGSNFLKGLSNGFL